MHQHHPSRVLEVESAVRTTPNIDDDVLIAVKESVVRESKLAGDVGSEPLRRSFTYGRGDSSDAEAEPESEFGFRPLPGRGGVVTNELIDRLREETGD